MAMDKPTKPTDLVPRTFGGIKNNFSIDLQETGYEPNIPQTYNGDNLNYQLDATGKELDYCEKICDFINEIPIGKTITVDANNKLVYDDLAQDVPIATTETAGIVKPDGQTITVENDGTIKSKVSEYSKFAINKGNHNLLINNLNELAFDVDNNNPLTYTNIMGETRTVTALSPIDVSVENDGTYKVGLPHTGNQPYLFDGRIVIGEEYEYTYTNVATSANAISSASYSGQPNTYAFDSNTSTFWLTNNSGSSINNNDYIGQSGLTQKIAKIRVMQGDGYSNTDYCSHYKIQYSEDSGVTWNDIQEVTNGINNTWQEITLQDYNVTGTYSLRLLATQYSGISSTNWGILELQLLVQDSVSIGDVWINPQELYTAKQYDGADWQDFNDVILLDSSVTMAGGIITNLIQPKYNSNHIEPKFNNNPQIVETYKNGKSWYRIYSDGWCEQGGWIADVTSVTFLKPYKDTNYWVGGSRNGSGSTTETAQYTSIAITNTLTETGFSTSAGTKFWEAKGYIF